ncbi:MAG: autotransporter outer membrane beta-barrel domain-containing protein [Alphaproteobacteria bacterium]|nr:autotransporter outer membrane beta-barrel domain-containing protein [Alphaproteobacteria bacterium]
MFSFLFCQVKKRFALLTCCFVLVLNFPVLAEDVIYAYSNSEVLNTSGNNHLNGKGDIFGKDSFLFDDCCSIPIINDPKISGIYSSKDALNAEINVKGGTFKHTITIFGGYANFSGSNINGNKVVLDDGVFVENIDIYGGADLYYNGSFGTDVPSDFNAISNDVVINNAVFSGEEIRVFGAYVFSKSNNIAKSNKVEFRGKDVQIGGEYTSFIQITGGLSEKDLSSSISNDVVIYGGSFNSIELLINGAISNGDKIINKENGVSILGGKYSVLNDEGSISIYGGYCDGDCSDGEIELNKVLISSGAFFAENGKSFIEIMGGADFSEGGSSNIYSNQIKATGGSFVGKVITYGGFSSASGKVENNIVNLSNVSFDNGSEIYGGYSFGGDVLNNKVILSKGSFENATITGGLGEDSSLAKDNIVALMEGVDVTESSISGGIADESLGNSLLVASNNLEAKSIDSFQNYYFIILEKNITLLSVIDGLNINLEDSKFDVVAKKGSVLSLGDTVTLLSNVELSNYSSNDDLKLSNDILDILNQIKDEKENNLISVTDIYKFALEFDNNSLIARVIDVKEIPEKRLDLSNISSDNLEAAKTIDKANKEGAFSKEIYKKLVSSDSDAITDIKPENVQASIQNTVNISTMVNNAVNQRLFSRGSSGKNLKGKNGGDNGNNKVWGQLLYNHSKQSSSNDNPGFKSDTKGFAVGADTEITDNFVLGVGYAYDVTDIKSGNRDTDVDSHTFFAYANYDIDEHLFVKGNAGYSFAKYKEKVSYLGNKSKYDVNSILINSDVGYKFNNGLAPLFGLRYAFVDKKTYTDEANQKVKTKDTNVVRAVAGVDWSQKLKTNCFKWTPSAGVGVSYDINNIKSSAVVNVGSSSYSVEGKRLKRTSLEAHAGVSTSYKNWDFSVNYELNAREKFQSHTGMVKATYNF